MISIIAAMGKNRVIGKGGKLPWHLPRDMKRFRELTAGKPVIMGRKTFESIGKPLPGRTNIILTRNLKYWATGCISAHSVENALKAAGGAAEIMVIGGEEIYKQFLPLADRIYLTFIEQNFEGDAYFPEINVTEWKEIERVEHLPDSANPYRYRFVTLERIRKGSAPKLKPGLR